ncbi:MAG: pentapeptide repeat-containing protein [Gammaproteobacteria bacterium]|nr:pentapeptide repeat-containing protein [Gammaproteobacteria bacterium]
MDWITKQRIRRSLWTTAALVLFGWSVIYFTPWSEIGCWLQKVEENRESNSTTIRNVGLIPIAIFALLVAFWRSKVAHLSLLNERHQKSSEMLGSEVLAARLGGIYALDALAKEYPKKYHVQAIRLFCAFVRRPTVDERAKQDQPVQIKTAGENYVPKFRIREDIQAIMDIISTRNEAHINHEKKAGLFWVDLQHSDLKCVNLAGKKLPYSIFYGADLSFAVLVGADLTEAQLLDADLTGTQFSDTAGSGFFGGAIGLTQDQLDIARADPERPPKLDGVTDAQTGKQLVWRGKPLHDA